MQSGATQLADWMERRGLSQRETASKFGWDETFISKLIRGHRRPGVRNAVKIRTETGIPIEAWMSEELDESKAHTSKIAVKSKRTK